MKDGARAGDWVDAFTRIMTGASERVLAGGVFQFWQMRLAGGLWRLVDSWEAPNKTVDVGLQYLLDSALAGGTVYDTWYIGLMNSAPTVAAGDTMGLHGGWTENQAYSEGARQTWVKVRAAQTMSNTASKAVFTMNAGGQVIGGGFVCSDSTKGGGGGVLLCGAANGTGDKSPGNGDQIVALYTFSQASTN